VSKPLVISFFFTGGDDSKQGLKIYVCNSMKQFDCIIAGAGSAGLTLAYLLLVNENSKKSIVIIDKDQKTTNDRTWCFWEKGDNLFQHLVFKQWSLASFKSDFFQKDYNIAPYQYKMIRGIDFYEFMKSELKKHPNLTWVNATIQSISEDGTVHTADDQYVGQLVFDSTKGLNDFSIPKKHVQFLQHFKGYFVETKTAHFDPEKFTYMDFRIDQKGDCRFGYVLPLSATKALVEYTIFSETLLTEEEYHDGVKNYLSEFLNIEEYSITEEEFGVIPMTDFPFPLQNGKVVNIGISGGFAKASTGFTFLRSQQILTKIAFNLEKNLAPTDNLPHQSWRFKKYDSTLLKVLQGGKPMGKEVFASLFEQNGAQAVFKFLDEETSWMEEMKIMSTTPILTFGKAFLKSI
jgi:lycopene beta-cyclase